MAYEGKGGKEIDKIDLHKVHCLQVWIAHWSLFFLQLIHVNENNLKIKIQESLYKGILKSFGKTVPNWKWPHVQEKGKLN